MRSRNKVKQDLRNKVEEQIVRVKIGWRGICKVGTNGGKSRGTCR